MTGQLETIHLLSEVRDAMRFKSNRSLKAACERHGVPILDISRQTKALRHSDYELLLSRASKPASEVRS
ncbi:hypothetical protein ACM41_26435 [Bradyrhizobium sp. CCBAU 21362]|uniref:hypothetical protein n=1 Tax=Bradyrhizobium TaxID=374 RepID=UPI0023059977|nr:MULTISPECIES: hypothetical protein [Bradyrhizobium]MDA9539641.1 hypothetical protein [Bradyrhizobium sp. CCBAU 21362]MDF0495379.1 hypothetical protein [Bradyrhizobium yuanmingense]